MDNKLKDKVFYTLSSVSFSLLSVGFTLDNNSIYGMFFGAIAFILGIKAVRIKK